MKHKQTGMVIDLSKKGRKDQEVHRGGGDWGRVKLKFGGIMYLFIVRCEE